MTPRWLLLLAAVAADPGGAINDLSPWDERSWKPFVDPSHLVHKYHPRVNLQAIDETYQKVKALEGGQLQVDKKLLAQDEFLKDHIRLMGEKEMQQRAGDARQERESEDKKARLRFVQPSLLERGDRVDADLAELGGEERRFEGIHEKVDDSLDTYKDALAQDMEKLSKKLRPASSSLLEKSERGKAPPNLEQVRLSLLAQADANEKSAEMWQHKTSMLGGMRMSLMEERKKARAPVHSAWHPASHVDLVQHAAWPLLPLPEAPAAAPWVIPGQAEFAKLDKVMDKQLRKETHTFDKLDRIDQKRAAWNAEDQATVKQLAQDRSAAIEENWEERKQQMAAENLPADESEGKLELEEDADADAPGAPSSLLEGAPELTAADLTTLQTSGVAEHCQGQLEPCKQDRACVGAMKAALAVSEPAAIFQALAATPLAQGLSRCLQTSGLFSADS